MSLCKICEKRLIKQKLFCSRKCYNTWQTIGSNACRVGRMAYTNGEVVSLSTVLDKIEEEKTLPKVKYTVCFNSNVSDATSKNGLELVAKFREYRLRYLQNP